MTESEKRGEYRPVTNQDKADFGVAYFKAHPGYGKDFTLPSKILAWWEYYFDTKEIPGPKANPLQVWFHGFTDLDNDDRASDETPGCASGLNAAMISAGFKGSRKGTKGRTSAAATSFMTVGKTQLVPALGMIVVMQHLTGPLEGHYHVTTYVEKKGNIWYCRGNNQGNKICVAPYDFATMNKAVAIRSEFEPLGA